MQVSEGIDVREETRGGAPLTHVTRGGESLTHGGSRGGLGFRVQGLAFRVTYAWRQRRQSVTLFSGVAQRHGDRQSVGSFLGGN